MLKRRAYLQLMEKLNSTHFNDSRTFADYEKIAHFKLLENTLFEVILEMLKSSQINERSCDNCDDKR